MDVMTHSSVTDVIHPDTLTKLATHRGPSLSIFIPTARHGPETRQGAPNLRKLIRSVADNIQSEFGADEAAKLIKPIEALIDDANMWQHMADGLAIFVNASHMQTFRLPISFTESVAINNRFRLQPLLAYLNSDEAFYLLSLAQNSVRIFEASRQSINELPNDLLPASMEDALKYEDPERQLQSQSVGGTDMRFHGHGAGKELDKQAIERYFRAVDHGLMQLLGPTKLPILLACVDYYLPIYRSVTKFANVLDTAITGNPEHRSPADLHAAAVPLVAPLHDQQMSEMVERYTSLAGTGKTVEDIAQLAEKSEQGRIDTLLLSANSSLTAETLNATDVDDAIANAIQHGAKIAIVEPTLISGCSIAAILR
jgi:hypothetical protein